MADPEKPADRTDPAKLLRRLIDDSLLIASFGQRAGVLGDCKLFGAIQAVEAEANASWGSESVVALQSALNDSINLILPVTLVDLRRGWDPFNVTAPYKKVFNLFRFAYVLFAVLLITTAVHYSQWLKRAEAIVLIQEQDLAGQLDEKIEAINDTFLGYGTSVAETLTEMESGPALATLRQSLREAQLLSVARWKAHHEYNQITHRFYMVTALMVNRDLSELWRDYTRFDKRYRSISSPPPTITDANPCATKYANLTGQSSGSSGPTSDGNPALGATINKPAMQVNAAGHVELLTKFNNRVGNDKVGLLILRCLVGADQSISGVDYDDADLKQKIETIGLWLLPSLFGAFGAVVYHLRACWNRLRPDPTFGRAMLRVFLGAFGGIAFGWFWAPAAASEFLPQTLPLGAYAIAFLIGYSIDIFFALLDRLVATVSGAINNIGGDNPKEPAA